LFEVKHAIEIPAHNNPLTQMVLNMEGTRLATASEKGTLIRVFDTKTGDQIKEVRRGADKAEIFAIAFNPSSTWMCVSSDKGTIHIYGIPPPAEATDDDPRTRPSSFSFMKGVLPSYFSSEWSFAQFHLPEARCVVCFAGERNVVVAVCADGSYYAYSFDPQKGGECKQETFAKFLKQ